MFTKILVPLDGSELAEKVMPTALKLAKLTKSKILLVQVVEQGPRYYQKYYSSNLGETKLGTPNEVNKNGFVLPGPHFQELTHATNQFETVSVAPPEVKEAELYLERVKKDTINLFVSSCQIGPGIETAVVYGRSPDELGTIAVEQNADLIVMCTHGRSGFSLLALGSVATKIVQKSPIPVILTAINPNISPLSQKKCDLLNIEKVLVTLDGTAEAEKALNPAVAMALETGLPLHLYEVVKPFQPVPVTQSGISLIYSYSELDPVEETARLRSEAYSYLDEIAAKLKRRGIKVTTTVHIGEPAELILKYVTEAQIGLVVMATHARGRFGQLFLGSVCEEVVRHCHLPVLLVHYDETTKQGEK